MGIDKHERTRVGAHQVFGQSQQQAGLAATRLRHGQKVASQQCVWQIDGYAVALVIGVADPTPALSSFGRDSGWQGKAAPSGRALDHAHVVVGLNEVPEPGQFLHIEHAGAVKGLQ